jgi:hypothetical protein
MEFLRFGSSIPGSYWGCCACCIIQSFKVDPDAKASIQLVGGDSGTAIGDRFAGQTYREIFHQRLRYGTHSTRDMPNHAFLAIITEGQLTGTHGKAWLEILKAAGFEFIRTVCNSVYAGEGTDNRAKFGDQSRNHIFGLFRNVGNGAVSNPFVPPKAWTDLPSVVPEMWEEVAKMGDLTELVKTQQDAQFALFEALPPAKFYTRKELEDAGIPVHMAGQRGKLQHVAKPDKPKSEIAAAVPPASAA